MGKDYLGKDMRKGRAVDDKEEEKDFKTLDEGDIKLLKTYGQGPYSKSLKQVEKDIVDISKRVNDLAGIKESDTGLGNPALWDLAADKQTLQSEQPLQVNLSLSHSFVQLKTNSEPFPRSPAAPRSSTPTPTTPSTSSTSSSSPSSWSI